MNMYVFDVERKSTFKR